MMHSRTIYLQAILLIILLPTVASFIVNPSGVTTATALQKQSLTKLNLHVDPIHIHRDSLLRLDDPMLLGKESDDAHNHHWTTKEIHKFTNSLAPLILGIYLLGFYLSRHPVVDGGELTHVGVDPMFGGGILIGAGLYMVKWSVDNTFLSPP